MSSANLPWIPPRHALIDLSRLCPDFVPTLSRLFPDFVPILSRLCPDYQLMTLRLVYDNTTTKRMPMDVIGQSSIPPRHALIDLSRLCPDFVPTLSRLCPDSVPTLPRLSINDAHRRHRPGTHCSICPAFVRLCPDFVPALSRLCPDFVPTLSRLYADFFSIFRHIALAKND